jgi:hypothetical protein
MHRGHTKGIPLVQEEIAEFCLADARGVLMRVAFSSIVWNTGSNSPGELEMT